METFQERFLRLSEPWAKPLTSFELNGYLHLSLKHRYVWAEIPKNACSSIKVALRRMEIGDASFETDDRGGIHDRAFSPLLRPSQVWNLDHVLGSGEYTRFCYVRNPFSRTLSAYLDKIVRQPRYLGWALRAAHGGAPTQGPFRKFFSSDDLDQRSDISFTEFLEAVSQQSCLEQDQHWREQHAQAFFSALRFDHIGRFENFEQDFLELGRRFHPDFADYYTVQQPHRTNASSRLELYTGRDVDLVRSIYRKDFERLGYSTDLDDHL